VPCAIVTKSYASGARPSARDRMKQNIKRILRALSRPFTFYFDRRFRQMDRRIDSLARSHESFYQRFGQLDRITTDAETLVELSLSHERVISKFEERLDALVQLLVAREGPLRLDEDIVDQVSRTMMGRSLEDLGEGTAELLNWSTGHLGFSAQAGLWFNHPVAVEHQKGAVRLRPVNERIVEVPYALQAAARLAQAGYVMDFGAAESWIALALASLGHEVLALDLHPYPLAHPRVKSIVTPVEDWAGPDRPLDAIFSISTLEHVGLGAYGGPSSMESDLDRRIVERFRSWLVPGGELILTAPYGAWSVDDFQRTYDSKHLDELLTGWVVLDRRVCVQSHPTIWEAVEEEPSGGEWDPGVRGVVLLRATPS
jgi:hypothetical protein